jgi:peptidoglycan/LPS O-acetylase OafA/YrhL
MEYTTFTRLDPIAWGVLMALFGHKLPRLFRASRVALLCCGAIACVAEYGFVVLLNPPKVSNWKLAMSHPVTALGSAAVLLAVLGSQNTFLRQGWLLYLGKISYGLYVIHEFAHFCAKMICPASTPLQVMGQSVIGLALTILLAAASYRWLESPFLRLKERFAHVQSRPV